MKFVIGLFISVVGFILASRHLHQGIEAYWDFVAFAVVLLGTFAVMGITFPAAPARVLLRKFNEKFFKKTASLKEHISLCMQVYSNRQILTNKKSIEETLLKDGLEMRALGFSHESIMDVLSQRFEIHTKRLNILSGWMRRGAKYPPAFGLAGTVIGLIHLMRGISEGIDTKETGIRMAVALVATFYGLLISNLLLNPLGEWLHEEIKRDEMKAEASLRTISLIVQQVGIVEAHEMLTSFLLEGETLEQSLLHSNYDTGAGEAA
jgi:chemotaxis protein MotA